ncbi:MAG TPA: glycosyltransferase [Thermoguttaceae bacterium]|nr:glycosyltransferase [Thermoguttaceae bacterium]
MKDVADGGMGIALAEPPTRHTERKSTPQSNVRVDAAERVGPWDVDFLRDCAWVVAERNAVEAYGPTENHVGLAMVSPCRGFAHWRIRPEWIDHTAGQRGEAWRDCRLILRLYDVSHIEFDGLNAHRIQDQAISAICGHTYVDLPHGGSWQLAEVGFLLRNGEFLPAARSRAVPFASGAMSSRYDHSALLVDERGNKEEVGNLWDQEKILIERRTPRLRRPLRIAVLAFPASDSDREGSPGKFVSELASGLYERGHEVHVFVADCDGSGVCEQSGGVQYESLEVCHDGTPLQVADGFGGAAAKRLRDLAPFDLVHLHDWMTGRGYRVGDVPTVLSLSSIESTRCNGVPPNDLSRRIQKAEREVADKMDCILVPDWLRAKAVAELGAEASRVHAFSMEGRLANEWECPLDEGEVKMGIGFGPLDRLLLFLGPLEYAAGVDLILEAVPTLLGRWPNLRVALAGGGDLYGELEHRAHQLGLGGVVRLLGHVEASSVTRLVRAAEAIVLPSRYRVPFDDAVVNLARRAGRPVITTHGGPAHLVRHEETGIVTYDNPGSMVWAIDRVLGDPAHAQRMGDTARQCDGFVLNWREVSRRYLELCAACFPQLTQTHG